MKNTNDVIDFLMKKYLNEEDDMASVPDVQEVPAKPDLNAKIKQIGSTITPPKPSLSKPAEKPVRIGGSVK